MAEYQLASDGYDGVARSGVIRGDGKWIPCEAGNPDWYEYVKWLEASPDNNPEPWRRVEHGGLAIKLEDDQSAVGAMLDSVEMPDMPPPVEAPRRIPHRADIFTPPPYHTDASRSPTREQRESYRPLSEEERQARAQAPTEGVWTQDQVDADRGRREEANRQQAAQEAHPAGQTQPRPHQPTHAHEDAHRNTTSAHQAAHDDKDKKDDNKKK